MGSKLDIKIGTVYEQLTVIKEAGVSKSGKHRRFECLCSCGNRTVVLLYELRNGGTKSCGCLRNRPAHNRKRTGEASFNRVFRFYKSNSKRKGLEFNITKEDFKILTSKNCIYCGIEPKQFFKRKDDYGLYVYNGLDRLDNFEGYTINNVMPCCTICNRAKSNMTQNDFLKHLDYLVKYRVSL